jgi:hypothetical protein
MQGKGASGCPGGAFFDGQVKMFQRYFKEKEREREREKERKERELSRMSVFPFFFTYFCIFPFPICPFVLLFVACESLYLLINSFPSSRVSDGFLTSNPDKLPMSREEIGDENPITHCYGTCFPRCMSVSH